MYRAHKTSVTDTRNRGDDHDGSNARRRTRPQPRASPESRPDQGRCPIRHPAHEHHRRSACRTAYGGSDGLGRRDRVAISWAWASSQPWGSRARSAGTFSMLFGAGLILLTSRLEAVPGARTRPTSSTGDALWLDRVRRRCMRTCCSWIGRNPVFTTAWAGRCSCTRCAICRRGRCCQHGRQRDSWLGALWNGAGLVHRRRKRGAKAAAAQAAARRRAAALSAEQQGRSSTGRQELRQATRSRTGGRSMRGPRGAPRARTWTFVLSFRGRSAAHFDQSWWFYRLFLRRVLADAGRHGAVQARRADAATSSTARHIADDGSSIGYPHRARRSTYFELRIDASTVSSRVLALLRAALDLRPGAPGDDCSGTSSTLLLFCRSGWLPWLQRSASPPSGEMALSSYVSHSVICAFVFYGFGFGAIRTSSSATSCITWSCSIWLVPADREPDLAHALPVRPCSSGCGAR